MSDNFDGLTPMTSTPLSSESVEQPADTGEFSGLSVINPDQAAEDKYTTPGQELKAAAEHAASSVSFGLSTKAETGLGIAKPEDIQGRSEHAKLGSITGDIAGLLVPGAPEAKALKYAGELGSTAIRGSSFLSKVGAGAVKGAIENAMFQTGDEVSKTFAQDPNATAQTAVSDIGLSALLGGAIGGVGFGVIPELWDKSGADKFVTDFSDRIKEHLTTPDLMKNPTIALSDFVDDTNKGKQALYGGESSVKDQAVARLVPETSPELLDKSVGSVVNKVSDTLENMQNDKDTFLPRYTKVLDKQISDWREIIDNTESKPADIFTATENMKRGLDENSAWGEYIPKTDPSYPAIQELRKTSNFLRQHLEDTNIWGDAGKFQKETNSAVSEFLKPQADFNRSFGAKVLGDYQLDPDKAASYLAQLSKDKGAIRAEKFQNYIDAAQKYRQAINNAYETIGVAGPFNTEATQGLQAFTEKLPAGAKAADNMVKHILTKSGGDIGGAVGGFIGGLPGALAGKFIAGPVLDKLIPGIIGPVLGSAADGSGFRSAIEYMSAFAKGEAALTKGVSNVFKAGKEVLPARLMPTDKERTKLDEHLKTLNANPNQLVDVGGKTAHYLPNHGVALSGIASTAVDYLNAQRPTAPKVSPLDTQSSVDPLKQQQYNRVLDVAEQPLVVLNHIKEGTLQPKDVATIRDLYPDLYKNISVKLMTELTDKVGKDETIPYRTKAGMSLFLGQVLDSTFLPESIIAAQPVPTQQPTQQSKTKKPTAASAKAMEKTSELAQTPSDARAAEKQSARA